MRTKTILVAAVMALLSWGLQTLADDGYRQDYDYPDQGDDWYGGSEAPDSRYDFPHFELDSVTDGDDYGLGYERRFDALGFGPPVERTNTMHTEYEFRFGGTWFTAPECSDEYCGTPSWCSGYSICRVGFCLPSQGGHSCDDDDPCTNDDCIEAQQRCDHSPVLPLGETTGLLMSRAPGTTVATLVWDDRPDEDHYEIFRGEGPGLSDLACYEPEVFGTTVDDDGTIPPGGIYMHLVAAADQCGRGSLGVGSDGFARIPAAACP